MISSKLQVSTYLINDLINHRTLLEHKDYRRFQKCMKRYKTFYDENKIDIYLYMLRIGNIDDLNKLLQYDKCQIAISFDEELNIAILNNNSITIQYLINSMVYRCSSYNNITYKTYFCMCELSIILFDITAGHKLNTDLEHYFRIVSQYCSKKRRGCC